MTFPCLQQHHASTLLSAEAVQSCLLPEEGLETWTTWSQNSVSFQIQLTARNRHFIFSCLLGMKIPSAPRISVKNSNLSWIIVWILFLLFSSADLGPQERAFMDISGLSPFCMTFLDPPLYNTFTVTVGTTNQLHTPLTNIGGTQLFGD